MQLLGGITGGGNVEWINGRRYRQILVREEMTLPTVRRTVLWIGMNPSLANSQIDDRTCRREQLKSRNFGFSKYYKGNVLDIMQTDPKQIPQELDIARSGKNLEAIEEMACEADWIILAHGSMPSLFDKAVSETMEVLFRSETPIACFHRNRDNAPTHTRGLKNAHIPSHLVDIRLKYAP